MGNLLSHPIEDKTLDYQLFETLSYCVGLMQGYRMSMEDAHNVKINEDESVAVFGVFDGHGGHLCADIVSKALPLTIFRSFNAQVGQKSTALASYTRTIKDAFFAVDRDLDEEQCLNCGTTAIIAAVVANRYLIVANTGDLRLILSLPGGAPKTLSFDHKPLNMGERVRIENSGGYVVNGRVNEILALSRAFGDFKFKVPHVELSTALNNTNNRYLEENKKYFKKGLARLPPELFQVTVEPDVLVYDLARLPEPEFLVLACDGIWDCYTNSQLIRVIRSKLAQDWNLQHITEFILNDCIGMASNITGVGFDNMTIIIVAMHRGSTMDEWYATMKARIRLEDV